MKKSIHNLLFNMILFLIATGIFIIHLHVIAEEIATQSQKDINSIRIETDEAIVDSNARYTEFKGNVKATIDGTQILADWLKVNYASDVSIKKNTPFKKSTINEVIARGNVRIIFDDKLAITKEAIYRPINNTIVLSGENSKVTSGNNYITGDKITLNTNDATFKVESMGKKQVEALFISKPEKEQKNQTMKIPIND